ncbi:MAG: FtsK/SpoIIIE domain-containing protein [Actinomycetes bacterium]
MHVRMTVLDPRHTGLRLDVLVTAPAGTLFRDVRTDLLQQLGRHASEPDLPLFADGRAVLDDQQIGIAPLLTGVVLTVGHPGTDEGRSAGTTGGFLELDVVSGPDGGHIYRLRPGRHVIGRAGDSRLRIDDPDCSRAHAELHVSDAGVFLRDLGSTNGTQVDGVPVGSEPVPLTPSTRVVIGGSTLALRVPDGLPAAVRQSGDGDVDVNRSPRIVRPLESVEIRLPASPDEPRAVRVPLVAMLVPVLVAVPLAFLWSPLALLFALTTPVMLLGNLLSDKVTGRSEYRRRRQQHEAATEDAEQRRDEALALETVYRRSAAPDAAELLRVVAVPLQRLWERRAGDEDFLTLRLGTSALPSTSVLVTAAPDPPVRPVLPPVPVTVALPEVGVLGVAGPRHRSTALVRSLLAQVAALHSPRETRVVLLSLGAAEDDGTHEAGREREQAGWEWDSALWFPHAGGPGREAREVSSSDYHVGTTGEQVEKRVEELWALLEERRRDAKEALRPADRPPGPSVVLLLDGAQRLRSVPGVARLLQQGPDVRIYAVCLEADESALPVECRATVVLGGEVGTELRLRVSGGGSLDGAAADLTGRRWFERVARALAPLRDATPDGGGSLPETARLVDVLAEPGLPAVTDAAGVVRRWEVSPRSTTAVLGVSASGTQRIDLRRDGPHVLVAGTTGSGKSELLQTLVTSLALANRPSEIGFVLVDYKGGSAFAECARLPHTLGLVTDLDEHLTRRALESLTAEISRRERLLAGHGAKDIDDYLAGRGSAGAAGGDQPPLARLVLVIDEFRVLAEELPSFLDGLVRIAAVGRSLGIHVVLATQRPGGVVTADVKANVNLRICLRVRDASDSLDVLESRDAASIPEGIPGRAFSRTGSGGLLEFQTARLGGPPAGSAEALRVTPFSWRAAGDGPAPAARSSATDGSSTSSNQDRHDVPTDLARVVEAITRAAQRLALERLPSPWLAPLPEVLPLGALPAPGVRTAPGHVLLPFGMLDLPDRQRQETAVLDLSAGACLAVAGAPRSGRTSLLQALAVSAAVSPDPVVVYALDGGAGLGGLVDVPAVAAVVPRHDSDRATRLLRRLAEEIGRRQQTLAAGGFAVRGDTGTATVTGPGTTRGRAMPHLLLLVDDWPALQQAHEAVDGGRGLDPLVQILRSGPAVGVVTVVAGDRSVLTGQLGAALPQRLVLRMADPTDVVLAGVSPRDVPTSLPPGRGLLVGSGRPRLVQVASLSGEDDARTLKHLVQSRRHEQAPPVEPPFVVPAMPDRIDLDTLYERSPPSGRWLPVGVGGDDVSPVGFDLDRDGGALLVAGHPGSGRSGALAVLARGLLRADVPVAVVTVGPSPLPGLLAGRVLGSFGPEDGDNLLAVLDASLDARRPAAVLVDDAERVEGAPIEPVLRKLVDRIPSSREVVVLAGSTPQLLGRFSGVSAQVRKGATGLLLGPAGTLDGDLFGVRTPRRAERRPGRGLLVQRGRLVAVQVAHAMPATGTTSNWQEDG